MSRALSFEFFPRYNSYSPAETAFLRELLLFSGSNSNSPVVTPILR